MRADGALRRLWHVSESAGITRFTPRPRPPSAVPGPDCVWAVDDAHLPNYLLPRDCPRVCLRAGPGAAPGDRDRFFGATTASALVFVEPGWVARCEATPLWLHQLPPAPFILEDANAGYWIATATVVPVDVQPLRHPLREMAVRGAELRICDDLHALAAAAMDTTLSVSAIRLRNAAPSPSGRCNPP